MTSTGVKSNFVPRTSLSDDILVNRNETTSRQSIGALALQLANTGPIADLGGPVSAFATVADLPDATLFDLAQSVVVFNDPDISKNGRWRVVLNTGVKTWQFAYALQMPVIRGRDNGDGTSNSLRVSTAYVVGDGAFVVMSPFRTNGEGPIYVRFNDGNPVQMRDAAGVPITIAGALPAGVAILALVNGTYLDLLSDLNSAANSVAATDAAHRAEAARDVALGSVPNTFSASRTLISALDPATKRQSFLTESGREGQFVWSSSDLSSKVAIDPAQGDYIAPNYTGYATDGSSGAWLRIRKFGDYFKTSEFGDDVARTIALCLARGGGTVEHNSGGLVPAHAFLVPPTIDFVGLGSEKSIVSMQNLAAITDYLSDAYLGGAGWAMVCGQTSASRTELPSFVTTGVDEMFILFNAAHGLKNGDHIQISNTVDGSFNAIRTVYRAGERNEVVGVEGNRVFLLHPLKGSYTYGSTLKAWKVPSRGGKLGGFTLDMTSAASTASQWSGLKIFRGNRMEIDDIQVIDGKYEAIEFSECINLRATRIRSTTRVVSGTTGQQYAAAIESSRNVTVQGQFAGTWAATDFLTWGLASSGTCDDSAFVDSVLSSTRETPGAGMHGNARNCGYSSCDIENGAQIGGDSGYLRNCTLNVRRSSNAIAVYGTEILRGRFDIQNCKITSLKNAGASNFSCIWFALDANAIEEIEFVMTGGKLYAPSETQPIYLQSSSTNAPISFEVSDIDVSLGSATSSGLVRMGRNVAHGNARYAVIRNIRGYDDNTAPWARWDGGYAATEQVLPRQKIDYGGTSIATPIDTMTTEKTFKHAYPTGYVVRASLELQSYNLGDKVWAKLRNVTQTGFRGSIASGDGTNMASGVSYTVAGEVY